MIQKNSAYEFHETVSRLVDAAGKHEMRVFVIIDQAAAAADVGITLRPTTLIAIGRPKVGSLLMQADARTTVVLPFKIAVWQDGESVVVAYDRPSDTLAPFDLGKSGVTLDALDLALDSVTATVTK